MSRVYEYLFIVIALVAGVSVGLYTGVKYNPMANISLQLQEEILNQGNEIVRPVQDVVISNVQEEPDNVVEVVMSETKITPTTKLVIKKNYKKCGHNSINVMNVPVEIVNYTKSDLEEKYTGWKVEEFTEEQVILSRDIDSNCEDHFVIKEKEGDVMVYKEYTEDKLNLVEELDLNIELLSEEDKDALVDGVRLYGNEALATWKENYTS